MGLAHKSFAPHNYYFIYKIKTFTFIWMKKVWGANDLWARPIYLGRIQRPKPRRIMAQVQQDSLWVPPRVVQSSADPQYPRREG